LCLAESDDTGALNQWFLTGDAPPQGGRQYTSRGCGLLCALQHAQFDQ